MGKNIKQKIDKKFIIINKIRLCLVSFIISIFISIFFDIFGLVWQILILLLVVMFVITYFYIPLYYNSYYYFLSNDYIIIKRGKMFSQQIILKKCLIVKVNIYQGILQKIFKTKSILLLSPSTKTYISCIDNQGLDNILEFLK